MEVKVLFSDVQFYNLNWFWTELKRKCFLIVFTGWNFTWSSRSSHTSANIFLVGDTTVRISLGF